MGKRNRRDCWITLTVCLLMLTTLIIPVNVQEVKATTNLKNPRKATDGTVTWDCVWFGHYPQSLDGKGGFNNDPIKWRVLSVDGNEALLLADKNLHGGIPYNGTYTEVTWENCTMRSWLNGYGKEANKAGVDYTLNNFIDTAFTSDEQTAIPSKSIENRNNCEVEGGKDTDDKIFLLSIKEIQTSAYGFPEDGGFLTDTITARNTAYAASKSGTYYDNGETGWYWLRSPGYGNMYAAYVIPVGVMLPEGTRVDSDDGCVRPALHMNLASNFWEHAGTVSSDGTMAEISPSLEMLIPEPSDAVVKKNQIISASNVTKTYGSKPFSLNAKAKTKLSYKSSNAKVATVSSDGRVTLKGLGKATITITAAATANYNAASKSVTITVKPKKVAGLKVKKGKKRMTVSWKRDKKVTGYQITYAQNKKFKKGKKTITISKNKTIKRTVKKLKARKTYYVKVRAYKKVGKTKIYGAYSGTKKVKVR